MGFLQDVLLYVIFLIIGTVVALSASGVDKPDTYLHRDAMVGQICGLDFNPEAAHYEKHDGITDEGYTLQRWMEGTLLDGVWPDTQGKARYYASDDNHLITTCGFDKLEWPRYNAR